MSDRSLVQYSPPPLAFVVQAGQVGQDVDVMPLP